MMDVTDLSDEQLNQFLAEWEPRTKKACEKCGGFGCKNCNGDGSVVPNYCRYPEAAWRLLRFIPREKWGIHFKEKEIVLTRLDRQESYRFENNSLKRSLAEAAAKIASLQN